VGSLRSLNNGPGSSRVHYRQNTVSDKKLTIVYWTMFEGKVIFSLYYGVTGRVQMLVYQTQESLPKSAQYALVPDYFATYSDPHSFESALDLIETWHKLLRGGGHLSKVIGFPDKWTVRWPARGRPTLTNEQVLTLALGQSVSINDTRFPVI
jgi:hypothetical protein